MSIWRLPRLRSVASKCMAYWNDPECIHTVDEAIEYINSVGFLPLFKNDIPGFSLEERTVPEYWWSGDKEKEPWEWRQIIAERGNILYGKFFCKKAGFITKEWFPYFANYRRDGYDFDALYEDGKAPIRQKKIMDLFMEKEPCPELFSFEIKDQAGFRKDGERRTFRVCLHYLAISQPKIAQAVIKYVPEYGRYDDALVLLDTLLAGDVAAMYKEQLDKDLKAIKSGKPVFLLAKWLPSINTSSAKTKEYAKRLCKHFKMSPKEYRKTLAKLRAYGNVVETKMSKSAWDEINYETVPAKANMKYDKAFEKHDLERRAEYFEKVFLGEGKLNANGLMPYEIVHKITKGDSYCRGLKGDLLSELMWKKIVAEGFRNDWGFEDAIVVADGSGSMYSRASGSSSVMAIEICNALAIYFAEQLQGVFHNKAITFSERPQFIELKDNTSLKDKLEIMFSHCEVANTNIEEVFSLILEMAKCKEVPREELPKQVLVISDMEFDADTASGMSVEGQTRFRW